MFLKTQVMQLRLSLLTFPGEEGTVDMVLPPGHFWFQDSDNVVPKRQGVSFSLFILDYFKNTQKGTKQWNGPADNKDLKKQNTLLRYNWCRITFIYLKGSTIGKFWHRHTQLEIHQHNENSEHIFSSFPGFLMPLCNLSLWQLPMTSPPPLISLSAGNHHRLSVTINLLTFSIGLYKWSLYSFKCLISFTQHNYFGIRPSCYM